MSDEHMPDDHQRGQAGENGASGDRLGRWLQAHRPAEGPARRAFYIALRDALVGQPKVEAHPAGKSDPAGADRPAGADAPPVARHPTGPSGLGRWLAKVWPQALDSVPARRRLALGGVLLALLAIGAALATGRTSINATTPSTSELLAAHRAQWRALSGLHGTFIDADGTRHVEWLSVADAAQPAYRRQVRRPDREAADRIELSNGQQAWTIGDDGQVWPSARLDTAALSCAGLALPEDARWSSPERVTLDGRPAFRLERRDDPAAGHVYWLDAEDLLVRRIEDAAGRLQWARAELVLDPDLPEQLFRPTSF